MGEGRGHAVRARTMAEELRKKHRVIIYTSYDALAFLRGHYDGADENVEVRETPGLIMRYTRNRIDLTSTVAHGLKLRWNMNAIVRRHCEDFERDKPDIVITDFEPTIPRAAHKQGVPVMSLDHQHFIVAYDLSALPTRLRAYAWVMHPAVRAFGLRQQKTVVSAFYFPPLRSAYSDAVQVGPLLRPIVRQTQPTEGEHVLCYFRRHTPDRVVDLMRAADAPVRIYGLGERPPTDNLTFCKIDEQQFVTDLASSRAVIAAAGNQLSGETLHFGKPFLAIPEKAHHEQCINAHFVKSLGGGDWRLIEKIEKMDVVQFLNDSDQYRQNLRNSKHKFDGTEDALREIEAFLAAKSTGVGQYWSNRGYCS